MKKKADGNDNKARNAVELTRVPANSRTFYLFLPIIFSLLMNAANRSGLI